VNAPQVRIPARLADHAGELVREGGRTLLWYGEMTADLLAGLMSAGSHGPVHVHPEGEAARPVWIQRCWFDVAAGRMVVQLRERTRPA
jgi:hypothetical protein